MSDEVWIYIVKPHFEFCLLMFAQLAQDDEGFEIASFGGSLDDEEEDARSPPHENGALSPVPPKPFNEHNPAQRQSLDGETIFAVGEDVDKFSEDESPRNSGEKERLTARQ